MIEIVNKFEKVIYALLMIMLMLVLIAAIVDLAWVLVKSLTDDISPWLLESHEMIQVLGGFLLVLIGVELLDTIKAYFLENSIHVEIVVLLAIIAIARKVILLDPSELSGADFGIELVGIGVVIVGLSAGYYLIKKAGIRVGPWLLPVREISVRVIVHPEVLERLRKHDEERLMDMEQRLSGKLSFRSDPALHKEEFRVINPVSGAEFE